CTPKKFAKLSAQDLPNGGRQCFLQAGAPRGQAGNFYTETPVIAFFGQQFGAVRCRLNDRSAMTASAFVVSHLTRRRELLSTSDSDVDRNRRMTRMNPRLSRFSSTMKPSGYPPSQCSPQRSRSQRCLKSAPKELA